MPPEIWDLIIHFISPFHQWRIPWLRIRLTCAERQAMGLWNRIIDSDEWPLALNSGDLDPLLIGDIEAIFGNPSQRPYIVAALCGTSLARDYVQPDIFLQSLKAKVDPSTHEADFGTFVLNVSGVLDPGHPIEVPQALTNWHGFVFKFSQPGDWACVQVKLHEPGVSFLDVQGVKILLTEPCHATQIMRRWSGGSRTFPSLLHHRGGMFDGIFARRRGTVVRCSM